MELLAEAIRVGLLGSQEISNVLKNVQLDFECHEEYRNDSKTNNGKEMEKECKVDDGSSPDAVVVRPTARSDADRVLSPDRVAAVNISHRSLRPQLQSVEEVIAVRVATISFVHLEHGGLLALNDQSCIHGYNACLCVCLFCTPRWYGRDRNGGQNLHFTRCVAACMQPAGL